MAYITAFVLAHIVGGIRSLISRVPSERAQDLIEYALLSGIIAATLIGAGALLYSGALSSMAAGVSDCIDFNNATTCDPIP